MKPLSHLGHRFRSPYNRRGHDAIEQIDLLLSVSSVHQPMENPHSFFNFFGATASRIHLTFCFDFGYPRPLIDLFVFYRVVLV